MNRPINVRVVFFSGLDANILFREMVSAWVGTTRAGTLSWAKRRAFLLVSHLYVCLRQMCSHQAWNNVNLHRIAEKIKSPLVL